VDQPGVRAHGGADRVEVGDVDEVDLDGKLGRQQARKQPVGAHVYNVRDDRVVTRVEDREERGVQSRHAGREHRGSLAVVQARQLVL
jgi:hypothetical protein